MAGNIHQWLDHHSPLKSYIYVAGICLATFILGGKNIFNEEMVSLQGDMPRYLMNGVYFFDVLKDLPLSHLLDYSIEYYSRYPALSLGHHPPLISLAVVPFYWLFGISVFSGKFTILLFYLLGNVMWFKLIRSLYDDNIAVLSTSLFLTTPFIVEFSRSVMSELPALALMITAAAYLQQYLHAEKRKHLFVFAVSFVLSVYAKQSAILLGPVFALHIVFTKGRRAAISKEILWTGFAIILFLIPIGMMTVMLSPTNVKMVTTSTPAKEVLTQKNLLSSTSLVWTHHLTPPVVILGLMGIGAGIWKRDPRRGLFLMWIVAYFLFMTYLSTNIPRYSLFLIPAFCLFAASLYTAFTAGPWKAGIVSILLLTIGYQFVFAHNLSPSYAKGYEEASQFIANNRKGESVLYSAKVDTGYFIYFVRKYDSARKMIVLRADKVLATSLLRKIVEERITHKEEIYKVLKDYGICQIVVEDTRYKSRSLGWLQEVVQTEHFILKKTIPIDSTDKRLQKVSLKIYEYKSCSPANPDAILEMHLPIISESTKIRFGELLQEEAN